MEEEDVECFYTGENTGEKEIRDENEDLKKE